MEMERFRRILYRLLFPGFFVVLVSVIAAAALLIYASAFVGEDSPVAYPAYAFSAYALTIACAWIAKNGRRTKNNVHAAIHGSPFLHRYLTDVPFRMQVSLYVSLGLNVLYAGMKFAYGLRYHSVWFGTLAIYYFLLAVMQFVLLLYASRNGFGGDRVSEWKRYRLCGGMLMVMNAALSCVVVMVVRNQEGFHYPGYLIYVMAAYAFYNIICAVRNVATYRKYHSPVMSAAKAVKLATALVCMLSLETAMIVQFGTGENPEFFRQSMTGITGACVCAAVLAIAVCMVVRSTLQLRMLKHSMERKAEI